MNKIDQKGFTLVELLLAMAFFSFILLFATSGFIVVNRAYNKGLTVKLVQDEARTVMERFSREIRSSGVVSPHPTENCVTIGNNSYYWTDLVDDTTPVSPVEPTKLMWVQAECEDLDFTSFPIDVPASIPTPISILNDRVGVQSISFDKVSGEQIFIDIVLSTTDPDDIDYSDPDELKCKAASSEQYCDLVKLKTVVSRP